MRRLIWIPVLLVLGYLAICALLYFKQRSLIYYPQFTGTAARAGDFRIVGTDGERGGWIVNPGQADAVIYFGGNAEAVEGNREDFARFLPSRTVYLMPYRGYGGNPGTPSQDALFEDALALYDEASRRHPQARIAVIGRSLGSGVASYLATHRPVEELVLVTPFDSLASVAATHYAWLPVRWLLRDQYPSVEFLQRYHGRWLILRAGHDHVVPPRNTDQLIRAVGNKPRVVEFPDAGHDDISATPRYWQSIADFLDPPASR